MIASIQLRSHSYSSANLPFDAILETSLATIELNQNTAYSRQNCFRVQLQPEHDYSILQYYIYAAWISGSKQINMIVSHAYTDK
jgi:hypothetical protein